MTNIIQTNNANKLALRDYNNFMQHYGVKSINNRLRAVKSTRDLIKCDTNSISLCRKSMGDDLISDTIQAQILLLCESINVNQPLTPNQIIELTEIILCDYYEISITEVAHIFRRGKRGDFGKIGTYALNIENVTGWLDKYREERIQEFIKANEQNSQVINSGKEIYIDENGVSKIRDRQVIPIELVPIISKIGVKITEFEYARKTTPEFIDTEANEELKIQKEALRKNFPNEKID